jgi:DNA-binding transcriptional LysR family regulator
MQDLNDLFAFAKVVQHGGFSAAARVLHVTKSSLSKRVTRLEERYGARLIERSARGVRVTPIGRVVYAQCEAVVAGAEGAAAAAAEVIAFPKGTVRVACPPGLLPNVMRPILPGFIAAYPEIRVALAVSGRPVDLMEDGFDVVISMRERLNFNKELVMRRLGISRQILVAAPEHLSQRAPICALSDLPNGPLLTLALGNEVITQRWTLWNEDGEEAFVEFMPTLACNDLQILLEAALSGTGIALVAETHARDGLSAGRLLRVLPTWSARDLVVYMLFTSRRGMAPAMRAFIDYVAKQLPSRLEAFN